MTGPVFGAPAAAARPFVIAGLGLSASAEVDVLAVRAVLAVESMATAEQIDALVAFARRCLADDADRQAWDALIGDPDRIVSLDALRALVGWLVDGSSVDGLPLELPRAPSNGAGDTASTSAAARSSVDMSPLR